MNRHRSRGRRGYILVFFAMFLFGFMALAALVIDVGFARLTQRQMQTAVDAAALEGLRFRDEVPEPLVETVVAGGGDPGDPDDPVWRDYARRWLARHMLTATFDDNLNPSDGDAIGFGAGPLVELTGGVGDPMLNAGQLLTLPDTPLYKPMLQLNNENAAHGDMVAGQYDPEKEHWELPGYSREDFTPTPAGDAFLVRMRRTDRPAAGLDQVDNVSSHGPSIPYLFGRGALFPAGDRDDGYSPRHHGITVRATAIARQERVRSVGMPDSARELAGLAEFALALHYWNESDNPTLLLVDGEIVRETDFRVEGIFFLPGQIDDMPVVIGRGLPDAYAPENGSYTGYVPIYSDISGVPRVIGFGSAEAVVTTVGTNDPMTSVRTVTITRHESKIAAENASAIVCYALDVTGDDLTEVLKWNRTLLKSLFAPVSVR